MSRIEIIGNATDKPNCKFGRVACALWPQKTATELAQRLGITERGAQYLIDGERKVTARALALVVNELLSD